MLTQFFTIGLLMLLSALLRVVNILNRREKYISKALGIFFIGFGVA